MDFIHKNAKSESDRKFMCLLLAKLVPDLSSLEEIEDLLNLLGGAIKFT